MAKVGVIMPTHGLSRHLAVAVKSVVQQSHQDWTLNIVCDGAAEETVKLAERLASHDTRIRTARQARAGVAAARNRGIAMLGPTPDVVAFLDHDDRWLPGTLATLTRALESSSDECVGAHGIARFIDEAGTPVRIGELEGDLRAVDLVVAAVGQRDLGIDQGVVRQDAGFRGHADAVLH